MNKIHSWFYLLPKLWGTLFQPPATGRYPFEALELPPGFRGKVVMNADLCIGCGLCVRDCPAFALYLTRLGGKDFRIEYDPARCAYCGQCALSCRRGAIFLTNDFYGATDRHQDLLETLVERRNPLEEDEPEPNKKD